MSREYRVFMYFLLPKHSLPYCQYSSPQWYICYSRWMTTLVWYIIITKGPQLTLEFTLGTVSTINSIIRNSPTALKILCSVCSPQHPHLQATTSISTVFVVLHFSRCHIVGIIPYVALSDWCFSLSNMHLRFLHAFSLLDSSFLLGAK